MEIKIYQVFKGKRILEKRIIRVNKKLAFKAAREYLDKIRAESEYLMSL